MRSIVLCIGVLIFLATEIQARVVESFTTRGWRGDAFVNDQSGNFDSCVAIAKYKSGISMSVQVDANYNWWIGFSAPGWTMKPGEDIPLQFRIDRGQWQQGTANAVSKELARMPMPADGYIITRFRRGRTLYVYDGSYNYQFRLTGTSRLMARLAKCVDKNASLYGIEPSVSEANTTQTQSNTTSKETTSEAELKVESAQVIFNLMGKLSVQGLQLVDASERDENLKVIHAFAQSDARSIAVHIRTPDSYENSKEIMASMMSEAIKSCDGEMTLGVTEQNVDGKMMLIGNSSCTAGDYELIERYVIAPRTRGGAYVYALSDTFVGEGGGQPVYPEVEVTAEKFNQAVASVSK